MRQPAPDTDQTKTKPKDPALPIGQKEGEGSNVVQHEPDPGADPIADGKHRYMPGTGHSHGND